MAVTTSSCLASGESRYLFVSEINIWDRISLIELKFEAADYEVYNPESRIIPTSITYFDNSFSDDMELEFEDFGLQAGEIDTIGNFFV